MLTVLCAHFLCALCMLDARRRTCTWPWQAGGGGWKKPNCGYWEHCLCARRCESIERGRAPQSAEPQSGRRRSSRGAIRAQEEAEAESGREKHTQ
jgi:hypothetical protein